MGGLKDGLAGERDEARLMRELRVARRQVALLVAVADIAGHWPLERVTQALSDFLRGERFAIAHLQRLATLLGQLLDRLL